MYYITDEFYGKTVSIPNDVFILNKDISQSRMKILFDRKYAGIKKKEKPKKVVIPDKD